MARPPKRLTSPFIAGRVAALVAASSLLAALVPPPAPVAAATSRLLVATMFSQQAAGYRIERDLVYSEPDGEPLLLDAYLPEGEGPFPAVLVIHGGAWSLGNKDQLALYARGLAARGYAALAMNYRLAPDHPFPAQIHDCKAAVRWIRAHAEEYRVDPARIGAVGYSAGGHLAALLATTDGDDGLEGDGEGDTRIQCACAGGAPCDFRDLPRNLDALAYWLGGTRAEVPEVYEAASPAAYVTPDDAPIYFFQGDQDALVNIEDPRAMVELLNQAGVEAELYVVEGGGHIEAAIDREALLGALEFFDRHLMGARAEGTAQERRAGGG